MSEKLSHAIGITKYTNSDQYHTHAQSDVVKSVFHTLILPLGLSIGSPIAGMIYFIFAVVAYSTIFRAKSRYVFFILKNVSIAAVVVTAWILLIGFVGSLGAAL